MTSLKQWLNLQKEGILIGTGIAVAIWYFNLFPQLNSYLPTEHYYKLAVMVYEGSSLGAIIDAVIDSSK